MNISYSVFVPYIILSAIAFGAYLLIAFALWSERETNGKSRYLTFIAISYFAICAEILLQFAPYIFGLASRPITTRPGPSRWFILTGRFIITVAAVALGKALFTRSRKRAKRAKIDESYK